MAELQNISLSAGDNSKLIGYIRHIETFNHIIQLTSPKELEGLELNESSPYRGLRYFEAENKELFFGRDQFIKERLQDLEETSLMLILGASGSGKSSVVRAGIIPRLAEEQGTHFTDLTFVPKHDPFASFFYCLQSQYPRLDCQTVLDGTAETFIQAVHHLKPPDDFWLIFIDQFEELFTYSSRDEQKEKRRRFIEALVRVAIDLDKNQNQSVKIVAAMRADFLDRLTSYPDLVKLTDLNRPMLAEMHLEELRWAIEQPALHHGVRFESGLVEEIIQDIQSMNAETRWQAGYLPLLQYTLNLLWETEKEAKEGQRGLQNRTLNFSTYRTLGGVRGALQQRVSQIYSSLSAAEQLATQRIFLKLVRQGGTKEAGTEWKPVRRRAARSEFEDELEQKVLKLLVDQSLLVSNQASPDQEATIEIAHEVLLTSWDKLHDWILDHQQAIALRDRLNQDMKQWQAQKSESELWSGAKLEQVLELRQDPIYQQILGFRVDENEFINASVDRRDRLQKQEEERRQRELEQQKKALRATRRQAIAVTVSALTIIGAISFGWRNARQLQINTLDNWSETASTRSQEGLALLDAAKKQAEQYRAAGATEKSLAYYRKIRATAVNSLFGTVEPNDLQVLLDSDTRSLPENLSAMVKRDPSVGMLLQQAKDAEQSMTQLIDSRFIESIKEDLESNSAGSLRADANITDGAQRYTEGALRKTYSLLFDQTGAGADLNGNGSLDSEQEAYQIPCPLLMEIRNLWQKKQCDWFEQDPYDPSSPNCLGLKGKTLASQLFVDGYSFDLGVKRIQSCIASSTRSSVQ
ncbi:ATP-binding protein [Leptolyngbya ohadii]|uniref:ATP-binding protein n=1 Tax=Leptolyngbya ohadii TaxID=1962290 RepID=UPI000B59FEE6|nr:ATP-binding protein [Leptolyngbya ohadii]